MPTRWATAAGPFRTRGPYWTASFAANDDGWLLCAPADAPDQAGFTTSIS
ncbi:MAG: hypothetical protein R3F59_38790 [Myxococcota bacterium]